MTGAPIHLRGEKLLLDPSGAVIWPSRSIVIVADLHLEKGSAMAARGQLVPPWDTQATLDRLHAVLRLYRPRDLVLLGDSFHDRAGARRMHDADRKRLRAMAQCVRFTWVLGNHDPALPETLPGAITQEASFGSLVLRHEARPNAMGELCGHLHPKATVTTRAGAITRPCFVSSAARLMLPAFGTYTGGLDIRHPAIAALFPRGSRVFLRGQDRLFSFAA